MQSLIFFVVFSSVWASADHFLTPPIKRFLESNQIGPKNDQALTGISECVIGASLGAIAGFCFGPILAVSFTQTAWSWIATGCLIISSFLLGS